jgi:hypothetical protein
MATLNSSFLYFALVFTAGFILRPIRILYLVPGVGTRQPNSWKCR